MNASLRADVIVVGLGRLPALLRCESRTRVIGVDRKKVAAWAMRGARPRRFTRTSPISLRLARQAINSMTTMIETDLHHTRIRGAIMTALASTDAVADARDAGVRAFDARHVDRCQGTATQDGTVIDAGIVIGRRAEIVVR
jgi:hypothetical protein